MIPWVRAFDIVGVKRNVLVCGAQMSKTEGFLDLIGERLDTRPAPILYVGPSKDFVVDQFEPRLVELFQQAKDLGRKVLGGIDSKKQKKTLKRVAGVRVRLAHAGSSSALKSDPAALALIDEYDEMFRSVRGQGDVLGLVEARGFTYSGEFVVGVTSTCSKGVVGVEQDPATGLEFWSEADPETLESPIWSLFQEGTRFHFVWDCPHCGCGFVPRFKQMRWPGWPKICSPARARREAWLECPHCEEEIVDDDENKTKGALNSSGYFVSPYGHKVYLNADGALVFEGPPIENSTWSWWVSGLASPFVTFGERVETYLKALASGESDKLQTSTNAGFGELFAAGSGDVPEWQEVKKHALPYKPYKPDEPEKFRLPVGILRITAGVDVQKTRLVIVVRGWGERGQSWLLYEGELWGDTSENEVWTDLGEFLTRSFGGRKIQMAIVDSGFRPGKKDLVPEHKVYDFARRFQRFVFASKGYATQRTPIIKSRIEVENGGKAAKYGLELLRLDADYFKTFVHDRLNWPLDQPGAWFLHEEISEDYCRQIVSEARTREPGGKIKWVPLYRDNHFLDAEAMASAAGYFLGVQRLSGKGKRRGAPPPQEDDAPAAADQAPAKAETPPPVAAERSSKKDRFRSFASRFNRQ